LTGSDAGGLVLSPTRGGRWGYQLSPADDVSRPTVGWRSPGWARVTGGRSASEQEKDQGGDEVSFGQQVRGEARHEQGWHQSRREGKKRERELPTEEKLFDQEDLDQEDLDQEDDEGTFEEDSPEEEGPEEGRCEPAHRSEEELQEAVRCARHRRQREVEGVDCQESRSEVDA
jgi:hypothetical protein